MGSIKDEANSVYQDGPSGTPINPGKEPIRRLFASIDALIVTLQTSGSATAGQVTMLDAAVDAVEASVAQLSGALGGAGTSFYSTKTALNADLVPANGFVAQVYNDVDFVANEYFWMKAGATGTGSWNQTAIPTQRNVDRRVGNIETMPAFRPGFRGGNSDKYDIVFKDSDNEAIFAVSQEDGSLLAGAWRHKPTLANADPYHSGGYPCSISGGDIVVVHDNGAQTIDGGTWDFSACAPGSVMVCASWNRPAMAAVSCVQIDRNAELFVTYGKMITLVMGYGQSLSSGSNGVGADMWVNPAPDYILMPYTGYNSDVRLGLHTSGGSADTLAPGAISDLTAMQSAVGAKSFQTGQTGIETLCGALHADVMRNLNFAPRQLGMTLGVGGQALANLVKGTQAYTNTQTALTDSKAECLAAGYRMWFPALIWRHGESDSSNASYESQMVAFRGDFNTDSKAITGQASDIWFIMAAPSSFQGSNNKSVLAMLELHKNNPSAFVLSHPSYHLDYDINTIGDSVDDDNVHLSRYGYQIDGEYFYRAFRKTIYGKTRWEPLRPSGNATRAAATITIPMLVPKGPMVIDTTLVSEQSGTNKGFVFVDDSGSPPTINNVQISGSNIVLSLSATPTGSQASQFVEYAIKGHDGVAPFNKSEMARGNIRDSETDTAASDPSYTLRNWMVPCRIAVTI